MRGGFRILNSPREDEELFERKGLHGGRTVEKHLGSVEDCFRNIHATMPYGSHIIYMIAQLINLGELRYSIMWIEESGSRRGKVNYSILEKGTWQH